MKIIHIIVQDQDGQNNNISKQFLTIYYFYYLISGDILIILKSFSLKRNVRTLMCKDESPHDIPYIHGIRAVNALALVIFHKSAALAFKAYINRTDMVEVKYNS